MKSHILTLIGLCMVGVASPTEDADLYLTLSGAPLQTDHILISDIGLSDNTALTCWNWMTQHTISSNFAWYHRHKEVNRIRWNGNSMGWQSKSVTSERRLGLILTRTFGASAKEGTLTCISSNREYAISVEVHYLILSLSATIQVLNGRNGTFRVICTSYGGKPLSMSITGPSGVEQDVMNIIEVGTADGTGNDIFSAEIQHNGGSDGDRYNCNASNVVSSLSQTSTLKVSSSPILDSARLTSSTSVRVEWSQPSGGATVTGYVVHYSDGDTHRIESVPASSTSSLITGLTNCITYTFSVEATSEHLSGESENVIVELGLFLTYANKKIGTQNFLMRDIGQSSENALICWAEGRSVTNNFYWSHQLAYEPLTKNKIPKNAIDETFFGWYSRVDFQFSYVTLMIMRKTDIQPIEGMFSCNYRDISTVSVGIYYPILSMSARIGAVNRRNSTFRVICTAIGGRTLTIDITGPNGAVTIKNFDVANVTGMGNDSFSAEVKVFRGKDGDSYNCRASNGVSNSSDNTTLEVAYDPVIHLLKQTSSTSVRVEWSQPSGGATVTGYVVHYSDGDTDRNESVPASSTSSLITGLTNCITYNFSVEAISEHLSGESDILTIELGSSAIATMVKGEVVSPTAILVKWSIVRACSEGDGMVVKYRVHFTAESSGEVQHIDRTEELSVTKLEASLTGLSSYTNYSIQIATVNEHGVVGLYSYPITIQTPEDVPYPVGDLFASLNGIEINITWTLPLRPNGVIIAYEVSYRQTDSSDPETRLNTTDLETSFTTQSYLEEGTEFIFSVRAYTRVGPGNTSSITISTLSSVPEYSQFKVHSSLLIGIVLSLTGIIVAMVGIIIGFVKSKRSSKRGLSTEDNPAYGVSLGSPCYEEPVITKSTSPAAEEAVYEVVRNDPVS